MDTLSKSKQNNVDRSVIVDQNFTECVEHNRLPKSSGRLSCQQAGLTPQKLLELFESECISRHLDLIAREYKRLGRIFYTIGSCGHEANAAVAAAFRIDDMAFLHYRSAAFFIQRAKYLPEIDPVRDLLLSFMSAKQDPIAGGRHKVFGSLPLFIPPQTSTIASHLPKAVGVAASIKRAQTLKIKQVLPHDSVVLCSFGDASVNHSTALGAFNTARWIANKNYPLPIVFICEDNGFGISVRTPENWIEQSFSKQTHLHYIQADGLQLSNTFAAAVEAEHIARYEKKPVFLHLKMCRLLGHAGSDYELHYRKQSEIETNELNDPLLHTASLLIDEGILTVEKVVEKYVAVKKQVKSAAEKLMGIEQLSSATEIMASIIPPKRQTSEKIKLTEEDRKRAFAQKYQKQTEKMNLCQQINFALTDLMLEYNNILVFGEDVAEKGGVYRVTADLLKSFGPARVFDTLLDEQTILGQAIGHAHNGFLPIPEIQFLAYLHNAEDQLRGEAATLSFFSNGQYTNPMIIRIPSLGYQKGFGGHFHNDNSIAAIRDIPGVIIACPSKGDDAAKMLRRCVQLAQQEQRVIVFLEPIALYMEKDLQEKGDNLWAAEYSKPDEVMEFGELGVYGESKRLAILAYGNGHYLSQQAAKILKEQHDLDIKIIDLRWLAPLNESAILNELQQCSNILIVDEGRKTGSISEQLVTLLSEKLHASANIERITGQDSFITLGTSWQFLLPSKAQIVDKVLAMV